MGLRHHPERTFWVTGPSLAAFQADVPHRPSLETLSFETTLDGSGTASEVPAALTQLKGQQPAES